MTDYTELVKALRHCTTRSNGCVTCAGCPMSSENGDVIECINALHKDAADAIEALQAQLPKRGEWIHREDFDYMDMNEVEHNHFMCNKCGFIHDFLDGHTSQYNYCPNCGAKMEVQE